MNFTTIFLCSFLGLGAVLFYLCFRQACRTNDKLIDDIYDLRSRLAYCTDLRSELTHAYVESRPDCYKVILCDVGVDSDTAVEIVVKNFPKGDDPEFAELLAEELADHLNQTYATNND